MTFYQQPETHKEPNPVSFNKLVKKLGQFGFEGPKDGGRHLYMKKDKQKVPIPNPHKKKDINVGLLMEVLRKTGIARDDWMNKRFFLFSARVC